MRVSTTGTSLYETWVLTLRAWSKDPMTPLDQLPALADDTFTPETYGRLIDHLMKSLQTVSDRWQAHLERVWGRFSSPHELARELVSLRSTLSRRVQLSFHPSLPPAVREVLERDIRAAVARYQEDLERAVRKQSAAASVDHTAVERLLKVVRDNSFLAVLDYSVEQTGGRLERAPLPPTSTDRASTGRRSATRRVQPMPPTT